jgi:3-hydroxybutyryl-CoA dehydrogenase
MEWDTNIGEVMGHAGTILKYLRVVSEIGMIPIPIYKEQNGYLLNTLMVPLLSAAQELF